MNKTVDAGHRHILPMYLDQCDLTASFALLKYRGGKKPLSSFNNAEALF